MILFQDNLAFRHVLQVSIKVSTSRNSEGMAHDDNAGLGIHHHPATIFSADQQIQAELSSFQKSASDSVCTWLPETMLVVDEPLLPVFPC